MKKKLLFSILYLTIGFNFSKAQNLVPNPGFEVQDTCPAVSQIFKAPPWISATMGTPDLFNSTCTTQNLSARTGIGSSGVYLYNTFANNREYMEAPLSATLSAGQNYCVSFYVKRSNYRYACNRIGAYFSTTLVNQSTTSNLSFTPQVQNNAGNMLSATGWLLISGSFTASGGEKYILIGNFSNDLNTDTVIVNSANTSKVCFYAIDDISVTACNVGIDENSLDANVSLFPNPASDMLTIKLPSTVIVKSIMMYNNVGQEIKNLKKPESINGSIVFNDLEMPSGIYFISVLTNEGLVNKKMIIQK
ncbi:MAG: hypothetical protein A3F72_02295 [Bacteroidetes bacterium RIFCSPLOWO2_12_FULL_35_15]|nr:MAG: hypothetical protein A3F72_02295 [Bacteroidetes bacterium RIFCSPLOWO2_12_FULL_35_15]